MPRLQNPKVLQSSTKALSLVTATSAPTPPPSQIPNLSNLSPSFPAIKQHNKLSRRELTVCCNSSLLLLLGSQIVEPVSLSRAKAEEIAPTNDQQQLTSDTPTNDQPEEDMITTPANDQQQKDTSTTPGTTSSNCDSKTATKRAFFDISIDGEPVGRIIIGLYGDDAPAGAKRFSNLVSGAAGISYKRKEFIKIMPNYIQHGGLRSYGVDAEMASRTGSRLEADNLVDEWERQNENCPGTKNLARSVGIIVRDPLKPPPKVKLVAKGGKLEIEQEEVGKTPNGTEFVIATKDSPELDSSTLVVGRVLEGMDVVERIGNVQTVKENTSSPYFRVAKLVGDKRAVVAERGFNRPYSKVIVTNCGLMD